MGETVGRLTAEQTDSLHERAFVRRETVRGQMSLLEWWGVDTVKSECEQG
jgi:hypothetical protein